MRHRRTVVALTAILMVGAAVCPSANARVEPSAPPPPNTGLILYRVSPQPNVLRATLSSGHYAVVGTMQTRTWTNVVIDRDTALFYNKNTGAAVTGTYVHNVFHKVASYQFSTGWNVIAASCDTVFFLNSSASTAAWGLLARGKYTQHATQGTLSVTNAGATCDSMILYDAGGGFALETVATRGDLTPAGSMNLPAGATAIAGTDDSLLFYNGNTGAGWWGPFKNGSYETTGTASSFSKGFTSLAGTTDTILFYRAGDGLAATSTLKDGTYVYVGGVKIAPKWKLARGGK